jgi:predicted RNase H-like HicB family nuclease
MSEQPRYSMLIEWSDEDRVYIVSLPEWGKYAQTHGATYEEAVHNGREVLQMLIDSARTASEPLPPPRVYARAS